MKATKLQEKFFPEFTTTLDTVEWGNLYITYTYTPGQKQVGLDPAIDSEVEILRIHSQLFPRDLDFTDKEMADIERQVIKQHESRTE